MRTARSLTVSPGMHCVWGAASRGMPGRGVPCLRGVEVWSGGWGGIPACTEADPPVNRITHACENITLPQLRCWR